MIKKEFILENTKIQMSNLLENKEDELFEENQQFVADELRQGKIEGLEYPYWRLEAYIERGDFDELGTTLTNIILSDIAEAVEEGTKSMDNLEVLISKDSIRPEHQEAVIHDLKTNLGYTDEAITEVFEDGVEDYLIVSYSILFDYYEEDEDEEEDVKYVDEWQILYKDIEDDDEYFEDDEEGAYDRFEEVDKSKVSQFIKKTYKVIGNRIEEEDVDVIYQNFDESLNGLNEALKKALE